MRIKLMIIIQDQDFHSNFIPRVQRPKIPPKTPPKTYVVTENTSQNKSQEPNKTSHIKISHF